MIEDEKNNRWILPSELHLWEKLGLEYEQTRTTGIYKSLVTNENSKQKIWKTISAQNLFTMNNATKLARSCLKWKSSGWTNVLLKLNWLFPFNLEKEWRNSCKITKITKVAVFAYQSTNSQHNMTELKTIAFIILGQTKKDYKNT